MTNHRRISVTTALLFCLVISLQMQAGQLSMMTMPPTSDGSQIAQSDEYQVYLGGSIESIAVEEYATLEAALTAINTGTADLLGHRVNASDYSTVAGYANIEEQWAYDNLAYLLALNYQYYPLNNMHLRRAIAYSIDKTEIAVNAMDGNVDELDFALPIFSEYSPEPTDGGVFYDENISSAIHELNLAGMLDVDEDGVVEGPNGSEVYIPIWYPDDVEGLNESADIISQCLLDIGVNNTLVPMNFTYLQTQISNHNTSYGIALYQQELDQYGFEWLATTFASDFLTVPGQNIANIFSLEFDNLAASYLDAIMKDSAENYGNQALEKIYEMCPVIPLFSYRWLSVYSESNFENWPNDTYAGAFSSWTPVSVTPVSSATELVVAVLPGFFDNFFKSLNPFYQNTTINPDWIERYYFNPYMLVYDSPIATAPGGHAVPRQATSWETEFLGIVPDLDDDETRVNFYGSPDANWTDGTAMDAQDYRFTFDIYENQSITIYANQLDEVKVIGNYLAGVEFSQKDMYLYRKLGALPILPEHIWEGKNITGWNPSVSEAIGSGPFIFSDYTAGSAIELEINTNYYPEIDTDAPTLRSLSMVPEDPIPAESIVFQVFVDDISRIANVTLKYTYRVGTINFTGQQLMVEDASGYQATIPARVTANEVLWEVHATDIWGNSAIVANGSYSMTTETEVEVFDPTPILVIGGIAGIVIIALVVRSRRKSN